jgi:hypothetical protein
MIPAKIQVAEKLESFLPAISENQQLITFCFIYLN